MRYFIFSQLIERKSYQKRLRIKQIIFHTRMAVRVHVQTIRHSLISNKISHQGWAFGPTRPEPAFGIRATGSGSRLSGRSESG